MMDILNVQASRLVVADPGLSPARVDEVIRLDPGSCSLRLSGPVVPMGSATPTPPACAGALGTPEN
jgi:hypothetical protein